MSPEIPKGKNTEDLSSLSREELAARAASATNPDEVRKITEAIENLNKAKTETQKPDVVAPLSHEEIIDQIKRASLAGDIKEIKRLNELLAPTSPQGPLLSAQEIQMGKMGIEPVAGTEKADENLEALRAVSSGKKIEDRSNETPPADQGAPLSRDEILRQMADAMKKGDVKETHRLSELLNPKPHESVKKEDENIPTTPAEIRAAKQEWDRNEREMVENEIKKLSPEEQQKAKIGLRNFGFFLAEKKDLFWAKVYSAPAHAFGEKGTLGRFFTSLKENFERDAKKSRANFEKASKEKWAGVRSTGSLTGNILKYGRSLADIGTFIGVSTITAVSPLRYVMMGGMFFARGAEAAKEARFKNEKLLEETRIHDIENAEEEAWKIYAGAKERTDNKTPSKEDIEAAYKEKIPQDILRRLTENPLPDIMTTLLQKTLRRDVERSAQKIQKKIEAIDAKNIPAKAKQKEKDRIIKKYEKHLKDLDRMVTQYATVDGLALGAKYAETAGKAVVGGMIAESTLIMTESLVRAAHHLWERGIPSIFSRTDEFLKKSGVAAPDEEAEIGHEIQKATGAEMRGFSAPPETPVAAPDEEAEIGRAVKEATGAKMRGALEFTPEQLRETVKSRDSVWKNAEQKLDALFGSKFRELDSARKAFVTDWVKDEIVNRLKEQGLDPDRLKIGQELDYSGILDNKEKMDSIFERANDLDQTMRDSIDKNGDLIANWAQEHPGERLTSERVEEIIHAKPSKPEIPTDYRHDSGPTRHENFYNGVSLAEAEAYGSRESAFFAKLAGLSEHEYKAVRVIKIRDIFEQIPSEREARMIWEGQIPGRTINLPYFEQYDKNEFEGHVRLAGILRHYLDTNPHNAIFLDITVDDFFKVAAPEEGPVFRGAQGPEIFEPEEFAQMEARAPIEQTSGKFAEEPYSAEYTPPDQNVGSVLIEGKDIKDFGSAEEAFVAKKQLGMTAREWTDIKSLETRSILSQTPEGAAKMNPAELRQWYETAKPKLPAANSFDSFRKQALLADAIRESLKTKADPEYLKSLPMRELVRNFVLEETGRGGVTQETVEKAAGFDHSVQAP